MELWKTRLHLPLPIVIRGGWTRWFVAIGAIRAGPSTSYSFLWWIPAHVSSNGPRCWLCIAPWSPKHWKGGLGNIIPDRGWAEQETEITPSFTAGSCLSQRDLNVVIYACCNQVVGLLQEPAYPGDMRWPLFISFCIFFEIRIKCSHNLFFFIFEQDMAQIIETNSCIRLQEIRFWILKKIQKKIRKNFSCLFQ